MKLHTIIGNEWVTLLDAVITNMDEHDGCAIDVLRLIRTADLLLFDLRDVTEGERAELYALVVHQINVFYYG